MTVNYCPSCGEGLTQIDSPEFCPSCGDQVGGGSSSTRLDNVRESMLEEAFDGLEEDYSAFRRIAESDVGDLADRFQNLIDEYHERRGVPDFYDEEES